MPQEVAAGESYIPIRLAPTGAAKTTKHRASAMFRIKKPPRGRTFGRG